VIRTVTRSRSRVGSARAAWADIARTYGYRPGQVVARCHTADRWCFRVETNPPTKKGKDMARSRKKKPAGSGKRALALLGGAVTSGVAGATAFRFLKLNPIVTAGVLTGGSALALGLSGDKDLLAWYSGGALGASTALFTVAGIGGIVEARQKSKTEKAEQQKQLQAVNELLAGKQESNRPDGDFARRFEDEAYEYDEPEEALAAA